MVVGNLYGSLGNSALPNLAEEWGTHRSLVKAKAGKTSLGYEHPICYLKCEPLGRGWSTILLHFFLFYSTNVPPVLQRYQIYHFYRPCFALTKVFSLFCAFINLFPYFPSTSILNSNLCCFISLSCALLQSEGFLGRNQLGTMVESISCK